MFYGKCLVLLGLIVFVLQFSRVYNDIGCTSLQMSCQQNKISAGMLLYLCLVVSIENKIAFSTNVTMLTLQSCCRMKFSKNV